MEPLLAHPSGYKLVNCAVSPKPRAVDLPERFAAIRGLEVEPLRARSNDPGLALRGGSGRFRALCYWGSSCRRRGQAMASGQFSGWSRKQKQ
jgi:hypothetical protein